MNPRSLSATCVCLTLPSPDTGRARVTASDVTVAIGNGARRHLLVAHVYAQTADDARADLRVTANGVPMHPDSPFSPFHAAKHTVARVTTMPALEPWDSRVAAGTFWLDLDDEDHARFIGRPIVVAVSSPGSRGFVSIVAELVKKQPFTPLPSVRHAARAAAA
jgi:hypothetical protein